MPELLTLAASSSHYGGKLIAVGLISAFNTKWFSFKDGARSFDDQPLTQFGPPLSLIPYHELRSSQS